MVSVPVGHIRRIVIKKNTIFAGNACSCKFINYLRVQVIVGEPLQNTFNCIANPDTSRPCVIR